MAWDGTCAYHSPMPSLERAAIQSVEQVLTSLAELRKAIREAETSTRRALRAYQKSTDIREALEAIQPSVARTTVNEALDEVERARHEARRATFALGLQQGMSIGELGRAWGFSRQLAARYAKEVKSGD